MEYQNPWLPDVRSFSSEVVILSSDFCPSKDPVVPVVNQTLGTDNPMGIAAMMNGQSQAPFVVPQVYVCTLVLSYHLSC